MTIDTKLVSYSSTETKSVYCAVRTGSLRNPFLLHGYGRLRLVEKIYFTSKVVLLDLSSKKSLCLLWRRSASNHIIWFVEIVNISPNTRYFSNKPDCDINETLDSDTLRATLDKNTLYHNKFRSYNSISDVRQELLCRQTNDLLQTDSYATSRRIM